MTGADSFFSEDENPGQEGPPSQYMISPDRSTAQTFTTLHSFETATIGSLPNPFMNSEGAFPRASLIVSGNTLYGAAEAGGERLPFPDQMLF